MTPPEYHYAIDPDSQPSPVAEASALGAVIGLALFGLICVLFSYAGPVLWHWLV